MLDLREFRKVPDRLTDVLPWAALVAPEVVLNKDGSFQTTIRFRGPDLDSSVEEELVVKGAHLNNALRRFGSGWAIYAEAQRFVSNRYPESSFPDPMSALLDEKRKARFRSNNHFESAYYLTLVYLPPPERTRKVASLFLSSTDETPIDYALVLENFRGEILRFADLLTRLFPQVEILADAALLTYLHSTVSRKRHDVSMPPVPMYLDSLLADTPLLGGFYPKLGSHHLGIVGVLGFPGESQPGLLDAINRLPIETRWVTRFISLDKVDAKRELECFQRKWFSKRKGMVTLLKELLTKEESILSDTDAIQKAEDAQAALAELGTDDTAYGYFTATFILMNEEQEKLRADLTEVERIINGAGFTCRLETVNAVDAWLGSVPGNTRNNVRRSILNTLNLSHLLPGTSAVWGGQAIDSHLNAPCLLVGETGGSTPFRLSTHVGDVGHTLILGPTGTGKSTLLNLMEVQFLRYPAAQVYIFDKGQSSITLTAAVGGDHYNLGAEGEELFFQPLSHVDDEAEKRWAHDWLTAIAESENVTVTPDVKRSIWDALSSLAATPRQQRTLHALTVYLQHRELRSAFEPFTQNGAYGKLLDNTHDSLRYGRWQCFEMEHLMENRPVIAPVLAYLFHRLGQRFDGSPTLLVLDEAWLFLDHPVFASKIREWLKTLRKLNVSVIFATQSLVDVDSSAIAPTIKEACFTKIYLPNSIALQADAAEFYRRLGLNNRQIEMLAYATPKRDYYYTSPLGNRLFELALDPFSLAYCSGVSKEQTALVRELKVKTEDTLDFNVQYLSRKGLKEDATTLAQCVRRKEAA